VCHQVSACFVAVEKLSTCPSAFCVSDLKHAVLPSMMVLSRFGSEASSHDGSAVPF
jgi:hypothetical protein